MASWLVAKIDVFESIEEKDCLQLIGYVAKKSGPCVSIIKLKIKNLSFISNTTIFFHTLKLWIKFNEAILT